MEIIKASGDKQKFNKEKLRSSLKKAGASLKIADEISRTVERNIHSGVRSEEILNQVTRRLKKTDPVITARYSLKKAIMELGPTGFPFEKYVAELLREYGYSIRVGQIIKGHCIKHEIDVIAQKGKERLIVECKYHNHRGIRSDIKVALYTHARFLDIERSRGKMPNYMNFSNKSLLVTNTKCTSEAIRYGKCVGLKIISWRYPKHESLEYLIEKKKLYPITVLPALTRRSKEVLVSNNLMLVKDLLRYSLSELTHLIGLRPDSAKGLKDQAERLGT